MAKVAVLPVPWGLGVVGEGREWGDESGRRCCDEVGGFWRLKGGGTGRYGRGPQGVVEVALPLSCVGWGLVGSGGLGLGGGGGASASVRLSEM